jgi:hypothetical protein
MANSGRKLVSACLAVGLVAAHPIEAAQHGERSHIRFRNTRIAEAFDYAMKKSPAFEDLVQTLELQGRVVYLEEGQCHERRGTSCLQLMSTPGGRNIQIRFDPRKPIKSVVARLAHELYHASEIARDPAVVDETSVRALFERIGYRNGNCPAAVSCWETRAAVAFETLVTKQLNGGG